MSTAAEIADIFLINNFCWKTSRGRLIPVAEDVQAVIDQVLPRLEEGSQISIAGLIFEKHDDTVTIYAAIGEP